jgi:hypothetical protein
MRVTELHVSSTRSEAFLRRFEAKVAALERLAKEGNLDMLPRTPTAFLPWTVSELGVAPISRDGYYKNKPPHIALRGRVDKVLEALNTIPERAARKEDIVTKLKDEVAALREQRNTAEALAASAKADLRVARTRIAALESQLKLVATGSEKVFRFRPIPRKKEPS